MTEYTQSSEFVQGIETQLNQVSSLNLDTATKIDKTMQLLTSVEMQEKEWGIQIGAIRSKLTTEKDELEKQVKDSKIDNRKLSANDVTVLAYQAQKLQNIANMDYAGDEKGFKEYLLASSDVERQAFLDNPSAILTACQVKDEKAFIQEIQMSLLNEEQQQSMAQRFERIKQLEKDLHTVEAKSFTMERNVADLKNKIQWELRLLES